MFAVCVVVALGTRCHSCVVLGIHHHLWVLHWALVVCHGWGGGAGPSSSFLCGAAGPSSSFMGGVAGCSSFVVGGGGGAGPSSLFLCGAAGPSSSFVGGVAGRLSFVVGGGGAGPSSLFLCGAAGPSSSFVGGVAGRLSFFGCWALVVFHGCGGVPSLVFVCHGAWPSLRFVGHGDGLLSVFVGGGAGPSSPLEGGWCWACCVIMLCHHAVLSPGCVIVALRLPLSCHRLLVGQVRWVGRGGCSPFGHKKHNNK